MNDQTIALIRELAAKLGTTTEHLWGVLVAQARVDFFASTFIYIILIGFFVTEFFLLRWMTKVIVEKWESDEVPPQFPAIAIATIILGIICIVGFFSATSYMDMYLASILNPEYWALKQILK